VAGKGKEYIVIDKIFSSDTLRGRATQCWHVQRNGVAYVIKESWIHNGSTTSEIDTLGELAGLEDVPQLVVREDVKLRDGP